MPKAGIVLGWATFLAPDFLVHPTTSGSPHHSGDIQVTHGDIHMVGCSQPTMWEPRGLPLGKIRCGQLCLFLSFRNLRGASNSRDACFGTTYRIRLTQRVTAKL